MDVAEWILVISALAFLLLFFFYENYRSNHQLGSNRYIIISDKIPKRFHDKKIVFLSDLHNNEMGKDNLKILDMLEQEKPDYVFVGGDMIVSKLGNHYNTALEFMRRLAVRYPVYCGNGNHEARLLWREAEDAEYGVIYHKYIEELKKAGVHHLCNETIKIKEGSDYIYLSEIELSKEYYKKLRSVTLKEAYMTERLGICEKDSFHVLLAHNPAYFETYAAWGADLTLSGHVHGGIMRLPVLGGVISPSYKLFPKYDAGLFTNKEKNMIISVGLGSHSIKIRLFNPPKIDIITLKCQ